MPLTREEAETWVANVQASVAQTFKKWGGMNPVAFIITELDPRTGEKADTPNLCVIPFEGEFDEKNRKAFASLLHEMADSLQANGVAFASEAWMANVQGATLAESEENTKKWAGNLAEHPEKVEVVVLIVEHRLLGNRSYIGRVLRGEKTATITSWVEQNEKFGPPEGSFTHFLKEEPHGDA